MRSEIEAFKEQYETSWESYAQNKVSFESIVKEFNL